jgi:hypothetical protein
MEKATALAKCFIGILVCTPIALLAQRQTTSQLSSTTSASADSQELPARYAKVWNKCRESYYIGMPSGEDSGSVCAEAAELATRFPTGERWKEKRFSAIYAATALANHRRNYPAMNWAVIAVDVVDHGHDTDAGAAAAYAVRAAIEALDGSYDAADFDLNRAENYRGDLGQSFIDSPTVGPLYPLIPDIQLAHSVLARDLRLHAWVLMKLNRPAEAKAKLDEAAQF